MERGFFLVVYMFLGSIYLSLGDDKDIFEIPHTMIVGSSKKIKFYIYAEQKSN